MKNDLTCGVVRDLLPSYVEGLTSPESNTAVERHLSECPDCAQLRTALAGAPEQAGGSPSAFVPNGEVGSGFSTNCASRCGWSMKVESL